MRDLTSLTSMSNVLTERVSYTSACCTQGGGGGEASKHANCCMLDLNGTHIGVRTRYGCILLNAEPDAASKYGHTGRTYGHAGRTYGHTAHTSPQISKCSRKRKHRRRIGPRHCCGEVKLLLLIAHPPWPGLASKGRSGGPLARVQSAARTTNRAILFTMPLPTMLHARLPGLTAKGEAPASENGM